MTKTLHDYLTLERLAGELDGHAQDSADLLRTLWLDRLWNDLTPEERGVLNARATGTCQHAFVDMVPVCRACGLPHPVSQSGAVGDVPGGGGS